MNQGLEQQNVQAYSVRKIPVTIKQYSDNTEFEGLDKIKILELSSLIDDWENEILFSENGFYSLKGKEVENKPKEFYEELNSLINSKISEITFREPDSKEIAYIVKNQKLQSLMNQMKAYEALQLKEWQIEVYEKSINSSLRRAVLYKNNYEIIENSYKNGITVLTLMSEAQKWSDKTFLIKKENFESDFYSELINAFIKDKDINSVIYFEKYKDKLSEEKKKELEISVKELKNNIIAYNYAKELFSYELSESLNEKEIKSVKDKEIQSLIRHYISVFSHEKKETEENEQKSKNESNWEEIMSILNSNPSEAELYIDYSLEEKNQKLKRNFIENFRKNGYIETDVKKFFAIMKEMRDDFEKFKKKDISDFRECMSDEDFKIISEMKDKSQEYYVRFKSDYDYIKNEIEKKKIESEEQAYSIVKLIYYSFKQNFDENKKESDIESKNKIIKSVFERYVKEEEKSKERRGK